MSMDDLRHPDCRYCDEYERVVKGKVAELAELRRRDGQDDTERLRRRVEAADKVVEVASVVTDGKIPGPFIVEVLRRFIEDYRAEETEQEAQARIRGGIRVYDEAQRNFMREVVENRQELPQPTFPLEAE